MEASSAPAPAPTVPYTWPDVAIVNDKSSGIDDSTAEAMCWAVAKQVLTDFGPRWHIGGHFHFFPSSSTPPAGMWTVALLGSSDQAGALGYHDLTPDGLPLGKVFAATDRQYGQLSSVTLSHETLEMLADPWISLVSQGPDGKFYAWEAADAVEADQLGYPVDGVQVSAFVCPGWFGSGDPQDICYPAGRVSVPLGLAPGGYISVFDPASGQGWQQQSAQHTPAGQYVAQVAAEMGEQAWTPAELAHAVARVGSRRERRFRGRARWVHSTYKQQ